MAGRPPGAPNKLTGEVKETFVKCFHLLQKNNGPSALNNWADKNPDKFYPLISKLFPLEVTGEGGGPLNIAIIRYADNHTPGE